MIVLTLPATLTLSEAAHWVDRLDMELRDPARGELVVDAAALTHFDSSVLALLLQVRREAIRQQRPFAVRGAPAKLMALAQMYGVKDLLGVMA